MSSPYKNQRNNTFLSFKTSPFKNMKVGVAQVMPNHVTESLRSRIRWMHNPARRGGHVVPVQEFKEECHPFRVRSIAVETSFYNHDTPSAFKVILATESVSMVNQKARRVGMIVERARQVNTPTPKG